MYCWFELLIFSQNHFPHKCLITYISVQFIVSSYHPTIFLPAISLASSLANFSQLVKGSKYSLMEDVVILGDPVKASIASGHDLDFPRERTFLKKTAMFPLIYCKFRNFREGFIFAKPMQNREITQLCTDKGNHVLVVIFLNVANTSLTQFAKIKFSHKFRICSKMYFEK